MLVVLLYALLTSGIKPSFTNYLFVILGVAMVILCLYLSIQRLQLSSPIFFNQKGVGATFAANGYCKDYIQFKKGFVPWSDISMAEEVVSSDLESMIILKHREFPGLLLTTPSGQLVVLEGHKGYSELVNYLGANNIEIRAK